MTRRAIAERLVPSWIAARCETGRAHYERAGALYDSWRLYARGYGAEPGSPGEFARAMEARGFTCDRIPPLERTRVRWGLRLR